MARVYAGKGDQQVTTIPRRDSRPVLVASGTVAIYDTKFSDSSSDHIVVAPGTPITLDTTATELANGAGRYAENFRVITVLSTAGIVPGQCYLLTSSDNGITEDVRIHSVHSATELLTDSEIRGSFPTGSTLRGLECSVTFPASEADDDKNLSEEPSPYIVVWNFAGMPAPIQDTIYLQRGEASMLATLDDLKEIDQMLAVTGGDRVDPHAALNRAHRDLRTELLMAGADESSMHLGAIGRDYVIYRAAYLCALHSAEDDDRAAKRAESYRVRAEKLITSVKVGAPKPQVVALSQKSETRVAPKAANFIF